MRNWRAMLLLLLVSGAAALWYWRSHSSDNAASRTSDDEPQAAYDYEAHDVVLRQMGPDGRLAFQVEAREITQLPDSGRIMAKSLTLQHDPAGTAVGSPNRWTLTADEGELPAVGGVVRLSGRVRARGIFPVGGASVMTIATDRLDYDMTTQELSSDAGVQFEWRGQKLRCRKVYVNIGTRSPRLESCDGTFGL